MGMLMITPANKTHVPLAFTCECTVIIMSLRETTHWRGIEFMIMSFLHLSTAVFGSVTKRWMMFVTEKEKQNEGQKFGEHVETCETFLLGLLQEKILNDRNTQTITWKMEKLSKRYE